MGHLLEKCVKLYPGTYRVSMEKVKKKNMFKRVKKWLGIEGVKLELALPEEVDKRSGLIEGTIRFQSMHPQLVTNIDVILIEWYSRGRKKEKLIDEYELGRVQLPETFEIEPEQIIEKGFLLPFELLKSDFDRMQERNILLGGVASFAKYLNAVKSEFYVLAEAKVKGTALNPFDKQALKMK